MKKYTVDDLTEVARGFQAAAILIAAAELDVFTSLHHEPSGSADLAERMHSDPRATETFLDAVPCQNSITAKLAPGGLRIISLS